MAEGHTVRRDGGVYLITLRQGLKFHDGKPVRAQDCAPSLARWAARDTMGQTLAKPKANQPTVHQNEQTV